MGMHDVIVYDEEFRAVNGVVTKVSEELEGMLESYLKIMERAAGQGLPAGASAEALRLYIQKAKMLKGICGNLATEHASVTERYLQTVDEQDLDLY